jgi:DNA-binding transcriptional ArsR family regulator
MTSASASTLHLDSRALQVLAHPLRSRLLTALRMNGPATATALAGALETNTGATSYHLRKLASVGLVEETDEGRGRERWWRAATEMHGWTERDVADDPDGRAAADWLRRHYLRGFIDRYEGWLDTQGSWSLEWQDAAGGSDYAIRVSPAALAAFNAEFAELVERYRHGTAGSGDPTGGGDADASDAPDVETVQVHLHAFPLPRADR